MLGSDVRKQFDKGAATAWASDPLRAAPTRTACPGNTARARC